MGNIKILILLALLVLTASFSYAQNQDEPNIPPQKQQGSEAQETKSHQPATECRIHGKSISEYLKDLQADFNNGRYDYVDRNVNIVDNGYGCDAVINSPCATKKQKEMAQELKTQIYKRRQRLKEEKEQECDQVFNNGITDYKTGNYEEALEYFNKVSEQNCGNFSYSDLQSWKQKCNSKIKEEQAKILSIKKAEEFLGQNNCDKAQEMYNDYKQKGGSPIINIESRIDSCKKVAAEKAIAKREKEERELAAIRGYYKLGNLYISTQYLGRKKWKEAQKMVGKTTIGGFSYWRLPTLYELRLIYDNRYKIWGNDDPWSKPYAVWYDGKKCRWSGLSKSYNDGHPTINRYGAVDCTWDDYPITVILVW